MPLGLLGGKCSSAVWIFVNAAVSIMATGQAYAQVAGAMLSGTVKDTSGAVILLNAQVVITDVATGVSAYGFGWWGGTICST